MSASNYINTGTFEIRLGMWIFFIKFVCMKRIISFCIAIVAAAALVSCVGGGANLKTEHFEAAGSAAHADLSVDVELPVASGAAATAIREHLMGFLDERLSRVTSYENERFFDPYDGDRGDTEGFVKYYYDQTLALLGRLSQEDADERSSWIEQDEERTPEEKADMLASFPSWEYEYTLSKIEETPAYVVFQSQDYIYMGGAHGGVSGDGCLTFCKKDGSYLETLIDPDAVEEMQPLLEDGLVSYFSDAGEQVAREDLRGLLLLLDGDQIPLPAWQPFPAEDGLVFTYQQYEVAPYAAGMPQFTVPFEKVASFLTPEAKALLSL